MFMEYSIQKDIQTIDIFAGILQFFIVGVGGVLIGVIFGLACAFITKFTEHVRVIEPIFVFLLAYLSYLTAEMFHLSGIMAYVSPKTKFIFTCPILSNAELSLKLANRYHQFW